MGRAPRDSAPGSDSRSDGPEASGETTPGASSRRDRCRASRPAPGSATPARTCPSGLVPPSSRARAEVVAISFLPSGLDVQGHAVDSQGGFANRFAHGWVGVNVATDLPRVALEEPGQCRLGDQLSRLRAHDVGAEDLARPGVGNQLGEALRLPMNDSPAVGQERELADFDLVAALPSLRLRQPDRGDLGRGVGTAGDQLLLHGLQPLPGDVLRRDDALVSRGVREQVAADDVADRPDTWRRRTHPLIDLHEAALINLDACSLQADALAVRTPADSDQELVGTDVSVLQLDGHLAVTASHPFHLCLQADVDASPLEGLEEHA